MWNYSSCAVQGKAHIQHGIPCQDKTKTTYDNNTYVVALSDGAGSAELSHFGAQCVVNSISELFTSEFDSLYTTGDGRLVKVAIMDKLLSDIKEEARLCECDINDLAATLLAVAVKEDRFLIVHIGDGVIGYLDGENLKVASAPSNGEHANETYFVTSKNVMNTMRLFKGQLNNIAGFVLMSDGTERSLYNKRNNSLNNAVLKLLQRNILLNNIVMNFQLEMTFKHVIVEKTHDDCSIAILSRHNHLLRHHTELTFAEKCELYHINRNARGGAKRIERYEKILDLLQTPLSCGAISQKLYIKPKYAKRHLEYLYTKGLLKKRNGFYYI